MSRDFPEIIVRQLKLTEHLPLVVGIAVLALVVGGISRTGHKFIGGESLEFHEVGTGIRGGIHELKSHFKRSVMVYAGFGYDYRSHKKILIDKFKWFKV